MVGAGWGFWGYAGKGFGVLIVRFSVVLLGLHCITWLCGGMWLMRCHLRANIFAACACGCCVCMQLTRLIAGYGGKLDVWHANGLQGFSWARWSAGSVTAALCAPSLFLLGCKGACWQGCNVLLAGV